MRGRRKGATIHRQTDRDKKRMPIEKQMKRERNADRQTDRKTKIVLKSPCSMTFGVPPYLFSAYVKGKSISKSTRVGERRYFKVQVTCDL